MQRIADQLPAEIARLIHPDRRRNESDYWVARDGLVERFRGQWIGFANGQVIASGNSPVDVYHAAEESGQHPFVICVGHEDAPCRIRRLVFPYDSTYPGEPLPTLGLEFRKSSGVPGVKISGVIADTGADATVLPWSDCQILQLDPAAGMQSLISGVAGQSTATLSFRIWARLDGLDLPCRLQADFSGTDRILGRDVLNRIDILFRGPAHEIVVNP
jgi:Family of unknown function (DUF5678)